MRKLMWLAAFAVSPAIAGTPTINTPSGQPEAIFLSTSLNEAEGKIASKCMDNGWQVTNQTTNQVTCQVPFGGFKQALAGALLGNSYSTPPNVYSQFNMAQVGADVRVQARAWMETQMAFGQMRTMQYTDGKTKTGLMNLMAAAGASLPNGTVFNTSWIGFTNLSTDTSVMTVRHIYTGSPGARGGLMVGDQISAVNGKAFKNNVEFVDRLAKMKDASYPITI